EAMPKFERAEQFNDLRQAVASTEATLVLLAAAIAPGPGRANGAVEEADLVSLCRSRGVRIITWEPLPSTRGDGPAPEDADATGRFAPLLRESRAFAAAAEVLTTFGPPRTLNLGFRCGAGQGSLGARLFDAMHLVHALLGPPESIDAAVVTRVAASGVHLAP